MRVLAGLIAVAWALAGWRNMPRLDDPDSLAAGLSVSGCVVVAYWLGARRTREVATARAEARAEAHAASVAASRSTSLSQATVLIGLDPALGARQQGSASMGGLDGVEWRGDRAPELVAQDVEDQALADILGEVDQDTVPG